MSTRVLAPPDSGGHSHKRQYRQKYERCRKVLRLLAQGYVFALQSWRTQRRVCAVYSRLDYQAPNPASVLPAKSRV